MHTLQVFNFYTMNAWLVVFVTVLIVLPAWLWLFSDPTEANEHLAKVGAQVVGSARPCPRSCPNRHLTEHCQPPLIWPRTGVAAAPAPCYPTSHQVESLLARPGRPRARRRSRRRGSCRPRRGARRACAAAPSSSCSSPSSPSSPVRAGARGRGPGARGSQLALAAGSACWLRHWQCTLISLAG